MTSIQTGNKYLIAHSKNVMDTTDPSCTQPAVRWSFTAAGSAPGSAASAAAELGGIGWNSEGCCGRDPRLPMLPIFISVLSDMSGLKAKAPDGSGPRLPQGPRLPPPAGKPA